MAFLPAMKSKTENKEADQKPLRIFFFFFKKAAFCTNLLFNKHPLRSWESLFIRTNAVLFVFTNRNSFSHHNDRQQISAFSFYS